MSKAEQVSSLIGDIYDAALDSALWEHVLEKVAGFAGAAAAALVSHDIASATGGFYFSWGDDPVYTRLYFEKYIRLNPTLAAMSLVDVGKVESISSIISFDEFRKTRLYNEWARPQGYADATLAVIEKSATAVAHLTTAHLERNSPVSNDVRRRIKLILPHVRRAVAVAKIVELHKVEAATLAEAIDAIAAGVFLVGEGANIVRANTTGRLMIDAGDVLRADRGRLIAAQVAAQGALGDAISGASRSDVRLGARELAIPLASRDGAPYVAHILPLTTGQRRQARLCYAATAAVFVHTATPNTPTPIEAIARHFDLTPAELRVLVAIVEVGGVPEVAPVLGISETTVKTHLRHLFEKTGANRQADLVKIFAGFANPLVH